MSDAEGDGPEVKRVKELEALLGEERRQAAERESALRRQLDALSVKSTAPAAGIRLPSSFY